MFKNSDEFEMAAFRRTIRMSLMFYNVSRKKRAGFESRSFVKLNMHTIFESVLMQFTRAAVGIEF